VPRLSPASRPFAPTPLGFTERKCLCGPQRLLTGAPCLRPSPPPKHRKAGGASWRMEIWGFPSLGERRLILPPYPRPKCQVSSRGGVSCAVCFRARPGLQNRLSPTAAEAARKHTHPYAHLHTYAFTNTRVPPCFGVRSQISIGRAHFSNFAGCRARGAGRGQRRN
jgi:hypothetical protein